MKIIISGSRGFIGSALVKALNRAGHEVHRLIRLDRVAHSGNVVWNPIEGFIQHRHLDHVDVFIHLAGESIVGRWNSHKKQEIRDSRILPTQFLAKTMTELAPAPKVFLCASAIGYYGNRGAETLTEQSNVGSGFLAEVCRDWEAACGPAVAAGIRTVNLRFGVVLGKEGGALGQMLSVFKKGFGGPLGDGHQWMSWISMEDAVRAIQFCMKEESVSGPVNLTAPEPMQNAEFVKTLGHVLHRPAVMHVPLFALRMKLGECADEVLLASTRAIPDKLTAAGFEFTHSSLEPALAALLKK